MKRIPAIILFIVIAVLSVAALFPFYNMIVMGTYPNNELNKVKLLPGPYVLENLETVIKNDFLTYYANSLYIALIVMAGSTFISAMAGFAFAKYDFRAKSFLFYLVLGTLMIPSQLGLVGFVIEMRWFGMMNTHLPLIIPPLANAFGVFWMTQYIKTGIPKEMRESAVIDGCSDFSAFVRIVLPNIKSALTTLFLLFFLSTWDSYLVPLIVLNKDTLYTIPLMIATLSNAHFTDNAARMLTLTLSPIPVLTIFAIGSKSLIQGLVAGSLKE